MRPRSYTELPFLYAQSIFGAIGVLLFQTLMNDWTFRSLFWIPTILRVLASVVDIVIVNRWNEAIGLSDRATYMLGYNIVYQVGFHAPCIYIYI